MKQKFTYFVVGCICIMVGICGTVVVYRHYPQTATKTGQEVTTKTIQDVTIHETNTIKSAIDKIYDAVVVVEEYDARGNLVGTGTGFVYKKDENKGYILTNHHVIEDASTVKVLTSQEREIDAEILGSDEYSDIAVLSIASEEVLQVAAIGDSSIMELGDTVFTVGSPLGSKYMGTVTKGILSGQNRQVTVKLSTGSFIMDVLQTDAAINPGNSGGPLLNINGEVIGITSLKLVQDEVEGMGFAIPIELAMSSIDELENGKPIVRPTLGVQLSTLDNPYLLRNYQIRVPSGIKNGVVVVSVENDSDAARAGLQKGDVITMMEGKEIKEASQFKYILYQHNIGDTITLTVVRNEKEQSIRVTLTDFYG